MIVWNCYEMIGTGDDMNLYEMRKRKEELASLQKEKISSNVEVLSELQNVKSEVERVIKITENAREILDDIDAEFEKITALDETDEIFLWVAVMLQTTRWMLSPKLKLPHLEEQDLHVAIEDRLTDKEKNHKGNEYQDKSSGRYYEEEKINEYLEKHQKKADESRKEYHGDKGRDTKYRTWIEIMLRAVPYDAMYAMDGQEDLIPFIEGINAYIESEERYANITGKNHHTATLGHDPVLGWIFGTLNIMSSTISFCDFSSYRVIQKKGQLDKWGQAINYAEPVGICSLFEEGYLSTLEDYKRLPAAVVRQWIHFESDKYCKEGLPIPLLSIVDPEKAQELLEKGWNSIEFAKLVKGDLKQIGGNAILSVLINAILYAIYVFLYDSGETVEIKEVKVSKILRTANVISSSSNVVYTFATKDCANLDIGGIGSTLLTYFTSTRFIGQIKREYIENQFDKLVQGD